MDFTGISQKMFAVSEPTPLELARTVSVPRFWPVYVKDAVPAPLVVLLPEVALGPETAKRTVAPETGFPNADFKVAVSVCCVPVTLGPATEGVRVSRLTPGVGANVTVAASDFVGSAWLVAVTVTVCCVRILEAPSAGWRWPVREAYLLPKIANNCRPG